MAADGSRNSSLWQSRLGTARAIFMILRAEWLIRRKPMDRWRHSLGTLTTGDAQRVPGISLGAEAQLATGLQLAREVRRAEYRLPYTPKCLPLAMALQWIAADRGLATSLVIARQTAGEEVREPDTDLLHAWIELDGVMLIGECERADFQPVLNFHHAPYANARVRQPA